MNARCFIDSNVAIYPYDARETTKARAAATLLETMVERGDAIVSSQVLGEVYVTLVRLGREGVVPRAPREIVGDLAAAFDAVAVTPELALEAMTIADEESIHFYDAQIVAAARAAGCEALLTEALGHGRTIAGVRIIDPFSEGFDLDSELGPNPSAGNSG